MADEGHSEGCPRRNVGEIQRLPKFELRKGTREREQAALNFWSLNLNEYLADNPQEDEDAAKRLCLMTLGELAFRSIPASAKNPEDIFRTLQAHVNGLSPEDAYAAINNLLHLTNQLVDAVVKIVTPLPILNTLVLIVPYTASASARQSFDALRDGLNRLKIAHGDLNPQQQVKGNRNFNGSSFRNNNYSNNNYSNNRNNAKNNRSQGKKNFGTQGGNRPMPSRDNQGFQFNRDNRDFARNNDDAMELDYVHMEEEEELPAKTPKESSQQ